jgi:hypothetical protein
MNTLTNKRILLFAPNAFGYEHEIKSKMEAMGASVDYFDERPSNTFLTKALIRINRALLNRKIAQYYNGISRQVRRNDYDCIIFISSESVSRPILTRLKAEHPRASVILYLWDSVRNKKNVLPILNDFDRVLSFDRDDAKKYGFVFRPLFYIDDYRQMTGSANPRYDALFVGTVHSDRYIFVKKVQQQLHLLGKTLYAYFFFRSVVLYYKKRLLDSTYRKTRISDFRVTAIDKSTLLQLVADSTCLVDAQHPNQTGLTMRTIESLGAHRKLITTNAAIKGYDFYNPNNILVVDRANPAVSAEFFATPYQKPPKEVYDRYSIGSWVSEVVA